MEDGALIDVTLVATNQGHDENKKHLIVAESSESLHLGMAPYHLEAETHNCPEVKEMQFAFRVGRISKRETTSLLSHNLRSLRRDAFSHSMLYCHRAKCDWGRTISHFYSQLPPFRKCPLKPLFLR